MALYKPIYKPLRVPCERKPIEKVDILHHLVDDVQDTDCHAFLLKNVLSPEECAQLINASEKVGFHEPGNSKMLRIMSDDFPLSRLVFDRIKEFLPTHVKGFYGESDTLLGLNNRWRVGRYVEKDYFHVHADGTYDEEIPKTNKISGSVLTVMLYLNGHNECSGLPVYKGGATEFVTYRTRKLKYKVEPEPGLAIVFTQLDDDMVHRGEMIQSGTKYIARSDAMYEFPKLFRYKM